MVFKKKKQEKDENGFLGGVFNDVDIDMDELAELRGQGYEERIAEYKASQVDNEHATKSRREKDLARVLVPLLVMQVYHLPGNNWIQDLWQYIANNHPIFGICFHHRLHPIGAKTRMVALIGTLVFGLALTSFFELLYIKYPSYQKTLISFGDADQGWELTSGMLSLWTVGGGIHTLYNLLIWKISACSCMREGGCMESAPSCLRCPSLGKSFLKIFTVVIVALSIFVICLKVAIANDGSADVEDVADLDSYQSADDFGFVVAYLVGTALSFFVWYFLGLAVLFTGVLGCTKLPGLGGRPREVEIEQKCLASSSGSTKSSFDDMEQASRLSKKSSGRNSGGGGGKSNSFVDRGSPPKKKKASSKRDIESPSTPAKKKKAGSQKDIETGMAHDLKKPGSKNKLPNNEQQEENKPKKKKKKAPDGEAPTRELGDKNPSTRKKKQQEGKMSSSKLVFQPL